jgi:hypothetical protein
MAGSTYIGPWSNWRPRLRRGARINKLKIRRLIVSDRTTHRQVQSARSPAAAPMCPGRTRKPEPHPPKLDPRSAMPLRHNPGVQSDRNSLAPRHELISSRRAARRVRKARQRICTSRSIADSSLIAFVVFVVVLFPGTVILLLLLVLSIWILFIRLPQTAGPHPANRFISN